MDRFDRANLAKLGVVTMAGLAMSGCSWLPFGNGHVKSSSHHGGSYHAPYQGAVSGCTIPHAQAPIPMGCDPALVTVGLGGFSQQPQFAGGYGAGAYGAPQTATGGYGSHAGQAYSVRGNGPVEAPRFRSKLRGNLSVGVEKSVAGNFLSYSQIPGIDPELVYDPLTYAEVTSSGTPGTGTVVTTTYAADVERVVKPDVAFDDVHSTPLTIAGGLEYALTPRTSAFANAGYTYAEGNGGPAIRIDGELWSQTRTQEYDNSGPAPVLISDTFSPRTFFPNVENIANYEFNFSDMRRVDLEAGARHYFNPLAKAGLPRVTPFVSASAGASHFNAQNVDLSQNQAFFQASFEEAARGGADPTNGNHYEVVPATLGGTPARVELYDSQWVPRGALRTGLEWQATDRTAIAFETGLQVEGARKYINDEDSDTNVSIPFTIRGSFNF